MNQAVRSTQSALFATVAQSDALGLYENSEFRPRHVADFLGLSNADVSHIAGVSKKSVRYDDAIPREVLEHLEQIANICNMVAGFFGNDARKTELWFKTKNPMLGDIAPRDMVRFGRYDKLRRFVIGALGDNAQDERAIRRQSSATHEATGT